ADTVARPTGGDERPDDCKGYAECVEQRLGNRVLLRIDGKQGKEIGDFASTSAITSRHTAQASCA
ncbi:MAG: hypothetical protein ACJ75K_11570, partial [Actinomycetes bacterium]